MNTFYDSTFRVLILIILSLCISTNSIAMLTQVTTSKTQMDTHCSQMMGDVEASSPDSLLHHDKKSCSNHYECLGLELKSGLLVPIEMTARLNTKQSVSTYTRRFTDGHSALPDSPP